MRVNPAGVAAGSSLAVRSTGVLAVGPLISDGMDGGDIGGLSSCAVRDVAPPD
jgi:hypothetical protein